MEERAIFAMGGGGFTMEPNNPLLDDFVLSLARAKRAAHPVPADGLGRHDRADQRLQAPLRRAPLPPRAPLAVPPARPAQAAARAGARTGRDLRGRRLDAQPAGDLARAPPRRDAARRVEPRHRARGPQCGRDVLVPVGASPVRAGRPETIEGLGLLEGSLTVHADGEPERLPVWLAARARRHAAGRLGARRRRGHAVPRPPERPHRELAPGSARRARGRDRGRARAPAPRARAAREPSSDAAIGGFDDAVEELRRVRRMRREAGGRR